jgi:deoxyribonuclease-4
MRPIGYHITGGQRLGSSLLATVNGGFTAAQIFLGPPQKWELTTIPKDEANLFRRVKTQSGIKVYVHAPYTLHAFAKPENAEKNNGFLKKMLVVATDLGCDGFILHMGGTKWYESDVAYTEAANRLLNDLFMGVKNTPCRLMFENCASGNDMSGNLETISDLLTYIQVELEYNVGLCLDTLHAWAWGYDYRDKSAFTELVKWEKIRRHLSLIHLNSGPEKSSCGSKYDRHEAIHKGCIPQDCFKDILRAFPTIPVIIEGHDHSDILSDLSFVKHVEMESEAVFDSPGELT